jgi:hypothetical protein
MQPRVRDEGGGSEVEDHGWPVLLHGSDHRARIPEVRLEKLHVAGYRGQVRIGANTSQALDAQHLDATPDEILSEVRPVLASDTGDQRSFNSHDAILLSAVEESRHAADPQGILLT